MEGAKAFSKALSTLLWAWSTPVPVLMHRNQCRLPTADGDSQLQCLRDILQLWLHHRLMVCGTNHRCSSTTLIILLSTRHNRRRHLLIARDGVVGPWTPLQQLLHLMVGPWTPLPQQLLHLTRMMIMAPLGKEIDLRTKIVIATGVEIVMTAGRIITQMAMTAGRRMTTTAVGRKTVGHRVMGTAAGRRAVVGAEPGFRSGSKRTGRGSRRSWRKKKPSGKLWTQDQHRQTPTGPLESPTMLWRRRQFRAGERSSRSQCKGSQRDNQ
mmetsp:Transcript_110822/g.201339  ORF Transcript_110822/g.201339 Transcript_110822/m.201339 type:complete len:267 (-) Transcript_110822:1341-2141(-)